MTKKLLTVILVVLMSVCVLTPALNVSADDTYKAISFSNPTVVGDNGGYPRLEALPDGTLLLASSDSTTVLRLMRSTDGGKTWGASETIVDYTGTDYKPGNGYLFYDKQTDILYFTFRCPIETSDGYTANINYVTSTDGGKTWGDIKTICTATGPSQSTGGGMWEPTFYRMEGKLRVYYSSDVVKYGEGVLLNPGTSYAKYDTSYPYSPSIVTQNIVMHEYNDATGEWSGGVAVFGGYQNLTEYGYPEGTVKMRAGMQSITRLTDGTYAMTIETTKFRDWADYGGTNFPMVIDVCFSKDGVTFTEPRTIAQGHADGYTSAAPWVATLPDGRIAVSFQTDDFHDEPMPTEVGNYKQMHVVISNEAVSYDDAATIGIDDFTRYYPFARYNSDVTYNYWNSMFVHGYTLYAVGNHNTNDKTVTAAKGMLISTVDLTPTTGVPSGFYPIYTANDLINLMHREAGYSWADKYILMNDIDLSTATLGLSQSPIGTAAGEYTSFSGTFDGNGKTIVGVNMKGSSQFYGLFGHTTDATIRNLTVKGSISSTYQGANRYDNGCGIVGCATGGTWLQNITNEATVTAQSTAGGIVGFAHKDANTSRNLIIQNCINNGKISSTATTSKGAAGGIIGCSHAQIADITVRQCINNGAVDGFRYVGGIVGGTQHVGDVTTGLYYTKTIKCTNTASVTSDNTDCGGIFGLGWYSALENCTNYGNIASAITSKAANVGGIVGRAHVYVDINACYSNGTQSAYGHGVLGSTTLGTNVTVTNCYFGKGLDDAFSTKVTGDAAALFSSYPGLDFINTFEIKDGVVYLIDTSVVRMGDVNANKTIDNTDLTLLIRILAGWTEKKYNESYADLTGDGAINNRDAIALIRKLAGWQI